VLIKNNKYFFDDLVQTTKNCFFVLSDGGILGREDGDNVGEHASVGGRGGIDGINRLHDADLDTDGTSAEVDVAASFIDEHFAGSTGLDHVTVTKLHGLATLTADLTRDDAFATLASGLHDEADDTHSGTADGELVDELEAERFGLSHGAEAAVLDAVNEEGETSGLVVEALLDEAHEFAHAAALVTKDFAGFGGLDDDFDAAGSDAVFNTSEAIFGEFALEEFIEFSEVDTVTDDLSLLSERAGHFFLLGVCCGFLYKTKGKTQ
jgi:hypothetical protein